MKKLMTMAFVAFACYAGFGDGCCGFTGEPSCQIWFNGAANGRISTGVANQSYKTVKVLQVTKVQLKIAEDGSKTVILTGKKKGVENFTKTLTVDKFEWNVFGKNIASTKKSVSLESEIYFDAKDEDGTTYVTGVLFGTVTAKNSGSACGPCGTNTLTTKYVPGIFRGKYVGYAPATGCACAQELQAAMAEATCTDSSCLTFVEPEGDKMEYFCGDVTLKFDTKNSGYKVR